MKNALSSLSFDLPAVRASCGLVEPNPAIYTFKFTPTA
jgi:hypothetical protein